MPRTHREPNMADHGGKTFLPILPHLPPHQQCSMPQPSPRIGQPGTNGVEFRRSSTNGTLKIREMIFIQPIPRGKLLAIVLTILLGARRPLQSQGLVSPSPALPVMAAFLKAIRMYLAAKLSGTETDDVQCVGVHFLSPCLIPSCPRWRHPPICPFPILVKAP